MTTANRAARRSASRVRATEPTPLPVGQPVVLGQITAAQVAEIRARNTLIASVEARAQRAVDEANEAALTVRLLRAELGDFVRQACSAQGLPAAGEYQTDDGGNVWGLPIAGPNAAVEDTAP